MMFERPWMVFIVYSLSDVTAMSITDTSIAPCHPLCHLHRLPDRLHSGAYTCRLPVACEGNRSTMNNNPVQVVTSQQDSVWAHNGLHCFFKPTVTYEIIRIILCRVTEHDSHLDGIISARSHALSYWQLLADLKVRPWLDQQSSKNS